MNRGELREEVLTTLDEDPTAPIYWVGSDVERWLNNGLQELGDYAEFRYKSISVPILARRPYYDLRTLSSEDILSVTAVFSLQGSRWMRPCSVREMDTRVFVKWEQNNGLEERAILRGLWYLRLHPWASTDVGHVRAYCCVMPRRMNNDRDVPGFLEELHHILIDYALYEGYADDHQTQIALDYYGRFLIGRERLKKHVQEMMSHDRMWVFRDN